MDLPAEDWRKLATARDPLPAGWRRHGQAAHLDLIRRWVGAPRGRWLKTDLAEERSPARALLPHLDGDWVGIDVAGGTGSRVVAGDVRSLPFPAATFDGVLSTSTLDHFADADDLIAAIREVRRVLRPGGALILTMDNADNPAIRVRARMPHPLQLVPFPVGVTVDAREGRALLERSGFEVEATTWLLHAPFVIGTRAARWGWWERRALPWWDHLADTRIGRFSGHYVAFLARPAAGAVAPGQPRSSASLRAATCSPSASGAAPSR